MPAWSRGAAATTARRCRWSTVGAAAMTTRPSEQQHERPDERAAHAPLVGDEAQEQHGDGDAAGEHRHHVVGVGVGVRRPRRTPAARSRSRGSRARRSRPAPRACRPRFTPHSARGACQTSTNGWTISFQGSGLAGAVTVSAPCVSSLIGLSRPPCGPSWASHPAWGSSLLRTKRGARSRRAPAPRPAPGHDARAPRRPTTPASRPGRGPGSRAHPATRPAPRAARRSPSTSARNRSSAGPNCAAAMS